MLTTEARVAAEAAEQGEAAVAARFARYDETMPAEVSERLETERARLGAARDRADAAAREAASARQAYLDGRLDALSETRLTTLDDAWHEAEERKATADREAGLQSEVVATMLDRYRAERHAGEIVEADARMATARQQYASAIEQFLPAFRTVIDALGAAAQAVDAERSAARARARLDDGPQSNGALQDRADRMLTLPLLPPAARSVVTGGEGLIAALTRSSR